ncbi:hypothetical protein MJG53_010060 [Ovis ammon polii x Ovis aries]|uniref:Uncharacterized protein n=1 Tax=Ovis ammon polii x Ovis aries TaxID=2918886 RepID=A0ACB9UVZ3_9CETA|nr:hypothetical protein MJG53_010060 [Ovis ammon polii x Ovis aries]
MGLANRTRKEWITGIKCLDRTNPGPPLPPASDRTGTFFPASAFRVSPLAVLQHWEQPTPPVELNSLLLISHEFPDSSGFSPCEVEAILCGPESASQPYLPVSGLPFQLQSVALDDLGEFFSKLPLEELQGTNTLSQMQKQSSSHAPFLEVEKPSQNERGGAQDALEAALLIDKNLKQALLSLCGLFSACADPRFCRFLEFYFLDKVVKVIRKMGNHLTNLRRLTGPQAGQAKFLTCRAPAAFEE